MLCTTPFFISLVVYCGKRVPLAPVISLLNKVGIFKVTGIRNGECLWFLFF